MTITVNNKSDRDIKVAITNNTGGSPDYYEIKPGRNDSWNRNGGYHFGVRITSGGDNYYGYTCKSDSVINVTRIDNVEGVLNPVS